LHFSVTISVQRSSGEWMLALCARRSEMVAKPTLSRDAFMSSG